jgi:hypothetical protein
LPGETGIIASMSEKENDRTSFDRFKELTRKLVSVPKKEVDRKEAAYQRRKAKRKRQSA